MTDWEALDQASTLAEAIPTLGLEEADKEEVIVALSNPTLDTEEEEAFPTKSIVGLKLRTPRPPPRQTKQAPWRIEAQ